MTAFSLPSKKTLLNIFKTMVTIRKFEEEIARRWPEQQMRSPPHFYAGQEAIASSVCQSLTLKDQVIGNYRGHGYYLAKGGDPNAFIAEMYNKVTGSNEGKGGSMLLSSPQTGYMGSSAIVAGGIPIATGIALGNKMLKNKKVTVCFFGDAATEEGVFYESLNFAALKKLPILFVCENNEYAVTTHISKRQAQTDQILKISQSFGIDTIKIDGNNPIEVYQSSKDFISKIRNGKGPFLIEAKTYRLYQHVGEKYDFETGLRTKKEFDFWISKDPIIFIKRFLPKENLESIYKEVEQIISAAFEFATSSPLPKKPDLLRNVYPN